MLNKALYATLSDNALLEKLQSGQKFTAYLGIDPNAAGIHMGHLLPLKICLDLLEIGCEIIILLGGFTAQIGDPTDKSQTRQRISQEFVNNFAAGIEDDMRRIFRNYGEKVRFVNNKEWLSKLSLSDLLETFYYISVNKKLAMETFRNRIQSQNHLTMAEFIYPELQFLDFLYLNEKYNCTIQIGGGDQWGNISFGTHYVRQITKSSEIYSIATPLLVQHGKKIGKSEGACFVKQTDKFYNFIISLNDNTAIELAALLSIPAKDNIIDLKKSIISFAFELLYGKEGPKVFNNTEKEATQLFYSTADQVDDSYYFTTKEKQLSSILIECRGCSSKSEAKRKMREGGIYIDNEAVLEDIQINKNKFKLSVGKKKHFFIKIIN